MKKLILLLFVLTISQFNAQNFTLKEKLLFSKQAKINSGSRSYMGGKSRVIYYVPKQNDNVESIIISYSTSNASSPINLNTAVEASKLIASYYSGGVSSVALSLIPQRIKNELKIPVGVAPVDIYLMPNENINLRKFRDKVTFSFYKIGSTENSKNGKIIVPDYLAKKGFCIGIINPSSYNAVNLSIEALGLYKEKVEFNEDEIVEKLKNLKKYLDMGIISEDEYNSKATPLKQQLIDKL